MSTGTSSGGSKKLPIILPVLGGSVVLAGVVTLVVLSRRKDFRVGTDKAKSPSPRVGSPSPASPGQGGGQHAVAPVTVHASVWDTSVQVGCCWCLLHDAKNRPASFFSFFTRAQGSLYFADAWARPFRAVH
jgi:hypothetical protein